MADFSEHIRQAKSNLTFLSNVHTLIPNTWDWQVTVSFYSAVHLMNARIAQLANHHYRSHEKVNDALSPFKSLSTSLPEDEFTAYMILQNLSRRARYLCHHQGTQGGDRAHFTDINHFIRAIKQLDTLMQYMKTHHQVDFDVNNINCPQISGLPLVYFTHAVRSHM